MPSGSRLVKINLNKRIQPEKEKNPASKSCKIRSRHYKFSSWLENSMNLAKHFAKFKNVLHNLTCKNGIKHSIGKRKIFPNISQ